MHVGAFAIEIFSRGYTPGPPLVAAPGRGREGTDDEGKGGQGRAGKERGWRIGGVVERREGQGEEGVGRARRGMGEGIVAYRF
jgi:hypothetical protein